MKRLFFYLTVLALLAGCSEQIIDKEPVVRFLISGSVVDQDDALPIAGIQIRPCVYGYEWYYDTDTELFVDIGAPVLTDQSGCYQFDITTKPWAYICIVAQDIDGFENGLYDTLAYFAIPVKYSSSHLEVRDDTWDFGTLTLEVQRIMLKNNKPE